MNRHARSSSEGYEFGTEKRTVTAAQMLPENRTGSKEVLIRGDLFYWSKGAWVHDDQARQDEKDRAPEVSDPENLTSIFGHSM